MHDTLLHLSLFSALFDDFIEIVADGFSPQQFREGDVDLLAKLHHAYLNADAETLIEGQCQARYTEPMGGPTGHLRPLTYGGPLPPASQAAAPHHPPGSPATPTSQAL